jgi:hypothetical protein
MEPLTLDLLSALAKLQGLDLTDDELATLLPLVQAGRSLMDSLRDALSGDVEPSSHYCML